MHSVIKGNGRKWVCRFAPLFIAAVALLTAGLCDNGFAAAKKVGQEVFNSPEEAAGAFFQAVKSKDAKKVLAIFGSEAKDLVYSGDPVADSKTGERVLKMFEEKNQVVKAGDSKAVLELGADSWPLPIPIVEVNGKWRFDTKAGREEILNRRIGKNELSTIEVCRAYVDAQREYAAQPHDGKGASVYAQKFFSTPGKQDGLYWETKEGEPQSPVGIFVANAKQEGYKKGAKPSPYHGYFFSILKGQGKNASAGAYDYVARGKMIGGFALIAYPAKYGASGIMTFIVNHDGIVYQKDLGPKTQSAARAVKLFNPDKSWQQVK